MASKRVNQEEFILETDGIHLRVFMAVPIDVAGPLPSVQIHHGGGGYEPMYSSMAVELAEHGFVGIAMTHRGYPGSGGQMEYGGGEIIDIGNLITEMQNRPFIDPDRMGIMGYSRGAHNAVLAIQRYSDFKAGVLWSVPVDMLDHVNVNPWIAYMFGGNPEEVPKAYRIRSGINFVEQINCPLLIIHGESDDVIPVRHALRLSEALKKLGKPHELEIVPHEGHIWSPEAFNKNWHLTLAYFKQHLKD